jgi:uncharacterized protein
MVRRPGVFSLVGLVVIAGLGFVYSGLQPSYRLSDQVPDREQATVASGRLDAELAGSNPVYVLITLPPGTGLYAPQTLATIADTHTALESQPGIGNVWSLETLRRWLAEKMGEAGAGVLNQYVDRLPRFLARRFIDEDQNAVIVFGLVPGKNLTKLVPIVDQLDQRLDAVRADRPHRGGPLRRRRQRTQFHRPDLALLERPHPGGQHSARERRHRGRPDRAHAGGLRRPPALRLKPRGLRRGR